MFKRFTHVYISYYKTMNQMLLVIYNTIQTKERWSVAHGV